MLTCAGFRHPSSFCNTTLPRPRDELRQCSEPHVRAEDLQPWATGRLLKLAHDVVVYLDADARGLGKLHKAVLESCGCSQRIVNLALNVRPLQNQEVRN